MCCVTRTRTSLLDRSGRLIVQGHDLRYGLTTILAAERRVLGMSELADGLHRMSRTTEVRRHVQELEAVRRSVLLRQQQAA